MAAAAATAGTMGYCFSSATATSCIRSTYSTSNSVFKGVCLRALQMASISHSPSMDLLLSVGATQHKWRTARISAAVAQEEAAAAAIQAEPVNEEGEESGAGKAEPVNEEGEEAGAGKAEPVNEEGVEAGEGESKTLLNTKLYFGNLPYNCDSAQLAGIIQDYGSPEMVEVLYDRDTGRSRGFAFVTMSSIDDCKAVIENLDGSEYGGRTLRVNFSDKPKPREPLYPETEYKLFVGNLSWSVKSESLTQVFQEYGNVVGARVLYDGETGRSRGYGFVCYKTKSEMEAALQYLNGAELEGRPIRVSLAQGKKS